MLRPISIPFLVAPLLLALALEARATLPVEIAQETVDIPSAAKPAATPGTPGVVVTNPKLLTQFGEEAIDLNRARYTRYYRVQQGLVEARPDAILVLVPGFEGGAGSFALLAENLIRRAHADFGFELEIWGFDRRSNQLEDLVGLDIAEDLLDPVVAIDWLFGEELGLELSPELAAGPDRRAVFYNSSDDIAFLASWTPLVFSRDIDAVVDRASASSDAVFLGGHSAGTGFTARYAATDFDLTGEGPPRPGYAKLAGLVLIEGGGSSTGRVQTAEELDRIEARFDGGPLGAVRDGEPRCIDGETPCSVETESDDCVAFANFRCVEATGAYAEPFDLLNARILSSLELVGIQMASGDSDSGIGILQEDFGEEGNNAISVVPDLVTLTALPLATAEGGLGTFIDDDGLVASFATFIATSVGAAGPVEDGLLTWLDVSEALPPEAFSDNGPAPSELPAGRWGVEVEPTRFDRLAPVYYRGGTNFTDWYYPSSGLSVTSLSPPSGLDLDTSPLSLDPPAGRGRRDIDNRTQAAAIDIPVIALGASNGLTPVPASFLAFAESIGDCAAPTCDGTPRVVDSESPSPAFPTFGASAGGFEVFISEGYAHVDVVTAEDDATNRVVAPIVDFVVRNTVPEPSGVLGIVAAMGALVGLARARREGWPTCGHGG